MEGGDVTILSEVFVIDLALEGFTVSVKDFAVEAFAASVVGLGVVEAMDLAVIEALFVAADIISGYSYQCNYEYSLGN